MRGIPVRASHQQEGLWYLDALQGRSDTYNMTYAAHLRGSLDPSRLERCLRLLLQRHESLRTTVVPSAEHGGLPVLVVMPSSDVDIRFNLQVIEANEAQAIVQCERGAAEPFDLSLAPLFRASLIRVAPSHHVLSLAMHHIVFDARSMGVLLHELGLLYESDGRDELPPVVQYSEFAARQRGDAAAALASQLAYWRKQLAGVEAISLPTDRARPARRGVAGGVVGFAIPSNVAARMREVSRVNEVTPFMTLYAAFVTLLMRYTRQVDLCIGVAVAGRNEPDLDRSVGFFVNSLVLRADLQGDPTFTDLLARVRRLTIDAFANQDVAFDQVVAELRPEREAGSNPLFQVAFDYTKGSDGGLTISGLDVERIDLSQTSAKFDLTLSLYDSRSGNMGGDIEFSADLFDRSTIERMALHFNNVLAHVTAMPDMPISGARLTSDSERQELIACGVGESRAYPTGASVHGLFTERAAENPDAPAVICGTATVSYSQLVSRSRHVAASLKAYGVKREAIVGVFVPRSPQLLSAVLGTMEAGGAFLPLDPDYPVARLQYMVCDAAVQAVITIPELREVVERFAPPDVPIVVLANEGTVPEGGQTVESVTEGVGDRAAYVIYTSGSTGNPKGVVVEHSALTNHTLWLSDELSLGPQDRVLQKTSISFDASMPELFAPLASGGAVVLAPVGAERDLLLQLDEIRARRVSWVQWGPAELRAFLTGSTLSEIPSLRVVISGGEALDRALAVEVCEALPAVRLGNFYGPTEATVDAARYFVSSAESLPARPSVPIGVPVANGELHVLDGNREPLPTGVPGELYVGGAGLARGYLRRPDLTAERFVDHPFIEGKRLYRTGDLVRRGADGSVEHLGRLDHQVKLRGHRIELGEIESALAAHAGVSEAVAIVREDRPGDTRLVAYWVPRDTLDAPLSSTLRDHLRASLPTYMVPQHFVVLATLPRLPNGKTDRQGLPRPQDDAPDATAADRAAPSTQTEKTIAEVWCEVLGVPQVRTTDNFFDVGGHSLLAMRAIVAIERRIGVNFSPERLVFESLAQLAASVDHRDQSLVDTGPAPSPEPSASAGWLRRLVSKLKH